MTIPYEIELTPLLRPETPGDPALGAPLPFLGAVKLTVEVRVGRLDTTVAELLNDERALRKLRLAIAGPTACLA